MKLSKRILSFLLVFILVLGMVPLDVFAASINITLAKQPQIDIVLATGQTNKTGIDVTNFERDLRNALAGMGVDNTSISKIETVETVEGGFSQEDADSNTIYNFWSQIPNPNNYTLQNGKIINAVYAWNGYPALSRPGSTTRFNQVFIESGSWDTTDFEFSSTFAWHGCGVGSGFIFHYDKKLNIAYVLTADSGILHLRKIANVSSYMGTGADTSSEPSWSFIKNANIGTLLASSPENYPTSGIGENITITMKGPRITVKKNTRVLIDYTDPSPITSGGIGLWAGCTVAYSDVKISYLKVVKKSFADVLAIPSWNQKSARVIVNVSDYVEDDFGNSDKMAAILSRCANEKINYVAWGPSTTQAGNQNFIALNGNRGKYVQVENTSYYNSAVQQTATYIKSLLDAQKPQGTDYVIQDTPITINVSPESYKYNTQTTDYPNGRWVIYHDDSTFTNPNGQYINSGIYRPNLDVTSFDKVGKYEIRFEKDLIKTIYVHRMPIASFTLSVVNNVPQVRGNSQDLDSNDNSRGFGPGIQAERWSYKLSTAASWTNGVPSVIEAGKSYVIQLEVQDYQGQWSDPVTKYISGSSQYVNPIADFMFNTAQISMYSDVSITNSSYDPKNLPLNQYKWKVVKDNKTTIIPETTYGSFDYPRVNFKANGAGTYAYTLTVRNTANLMSDSYTKYLTVVADTKPPELEVNPQPNINWVNTPYNVSIKITDNDSKLNLLSYSITNNTTTPSSYTNNISLTNQTTSTQNVTINTEGQFYLHVKGTDMAGNAVTLYRGPYKIDTTKPVINSHAITKIGPLGRSVITNQKVQVDLNITENVSGFKSFEYKLPGETTYTKVEDGTKSFIINKELVGEISIFAYDNAGNKSNEYKINDLTIETTPPILTVAEPPVWSNTDVSLLVNASDTNGIKTITYNTTSSQGGTDISQSGTVASGGNIVLTKEGKYQLNVIAEDNASNTTAVVKNINIDKTKPMVNSHTMTELPSKARSLVTNKQVELALNISDNLSGFDYFEYKLSGESAYTKCEKGITKFIVDKAYSGPISIYAYDIAGNKSLEYVVGDLIIDIGNPTLTVDTPPLWSNTSLNLKVEANDTNGIKEITYNTNETPQVKGTVVSGETIRLDNEGEYQLTVTAKDNAENITALTCDIKIDKTKPLINSYDITELTALARSVITNKSVKITFNITDDRSGFKYMEYKLTGNSDYVKLADGVKEFTIDKVYSGPISIYAYDVAGNKSLETIISDLTMETTPPLLEVEDKPSWSNTNVSLLVKASDNNGIKSITYSTNETISQQGSVNTEENIVLINEGEYTLTVGATDNAGNLSKVERVIKIDKTKPNVDSHNIVDLSTVVPRARGGHITDKGIEVTIRASDKIPTSGIKTVEYKLNTGDFIQTTATGNNTYKFQLESAYTGDIVVRAIDNAGNISEEYLIEEIVLVNSPPAISIEDNTNWHTTNVSIPVTIRDESGLAPIVSAVFKTNESNLQSGNLRKKSGDNYFVDLVNEGRYEFVVTATNLAGSTNSATSQTISIDKTKPLINSHEITELDELIDPISPFFYRMQYTNKQVSIKIVASDNLSGIEHFEYKLPGDSFYTELPIGENTFILDKDLYDDIEVYAYDVAGNKSELYLIDDLIMDSVKPEINVALAPDWTNEDVNISFSASDNIGLESLRWFTTEAIENLQSETIDLSSWSGNGNIYLTNEGVYTLLIFAQDLSGNILEVSNTLIKIDKTAPTVDKLEYYIPQPTKTLDEIEVNDEFLEDDMDLNEEETVQNEFEVVEEELPMSSNNIFKDNVVVEIFVSDLLGNAQSGIDTVEYSLDAREFSKDWSVLQKDLDNRYLVPIDEDFNGVIYVRCTDIAGNVSDVYSEDVILDKIAPNPTMIINSSDIWNTENGTIQISVSDINGLASVYYSQTCIEGPGNTFEKELLSSESPTSFDTILTIDTDGIYEITLSAEDIAGNITTKTGAIKIDKTKPLINQVIFNIVDEDGNILEEDCSVTNKQLLIQTDITDNLSGFNHLEYKTEDSNDWMPIAQNTLDFYLVTAYKGQIQLRAFDNAGNISSIYTSDEVIIENEGPKLTVSESSAWSPENVELDIYAEDMSSGVKQISYYYSLEDGTERSGILPIRSGQVVNTKFIAKDEGTYVILFLAQDNAGNTTSVRRKINIDKTSSLQAPLINFNGYGQGVWTEKNVDLEAYYNPEDIPLSGIEKYQYKEIGTEVWVDGTLNLKNTIDKNFVFRAVTTVGLVSEETEEINVKIDKTKPVVLGTNVNDDSYFNSSYEIKVNVEDNESGIRNIEYSLNNRNWILMEKYIIPLINQFSGNIYVRTIDNCGNISDSYIISNINIDYDRPTLRLISGVNVDNYLELEASKVVVKNDIGYIRIVDPTSPSYIVPVAELHISNNRIKVDGNKIRVDISGLLQTGKNYMVEVDNGFVKDLSGNISYPLIPESIGTSFTKNPTITEVSVVSRAPVGTYSGVLDYSTNEFNVIIPRGTSGKVSLNLKWDGSVSNVSADSKIPLEEVTSSSILFNVDNVEFPLAINVKTSNATRKINILKGDITVKVESDNQLNASVPNEDILKSVDFKSILDENKSFEVVVQMNYDKSLISDENLAKSEIERIDEISDISSPIDIKVKCFEIVDGEKKNETLLSDLQNPLDISIDIPSELSNKDSYSIIRIHNGELTVLQSQVTDGKIKFTSDKFSTYFIGTGEEIEEEDNIPPRIIPPRPEPIPDKIPEADKFCLIPALKDNHSVISKFSIFTDDVIKFMKPVDGNYDLMTNHKNFNDIVYNWNFEAVHSLAARNIISGYTDGTFRPNNKITRAEFVTMLVRLENLANQNNISSFSDVPAYSWCFNDVEAAYKVGIVDGLANGKFAPDRPITRQEIAKILDRYLKYKGKVIKEEKAHSFSDEYLISGWAYSSVRAMSQIGVINGYTDGTFGPHKYATRAEASQMLWKLIVYIVEIDNDFQMLAIN